MGLEGDLYRAMLVIHILTVVFGLGPLVLAGLYAVKAEKIDRRAEWAVGHVGESVSKVAEKVVYLIFITGVALVFMSDGAFRLDDFWVLLSMVTFIVMIGISHGMLVPNERRMNVLRDELATLETKGMTGEPEQEVELKDRTKRSVALAATIDLLLVFLIYLMVFQPEL